MPRVTFNHTQPPYVVPIKPDGTGGYIEDSSPTQATRTALDIAAGQSISASTDLKGLSVLRLIIGAAWTAADITVQMSPDGVAWNDMYDEYGSPYTIKAAASRTIFVAPGPLLAVNFIRLRSGTPAAPVAQAARATVTLMSVPL